jgi:hypothetical protein
VEGREHFRDQGVEDRICVKMEFKERGCEDGDWIHLSEERMQWWALVNAVLKLQFL